MQRFNKLLSLCFFVLPFSGCASISAYSFTDNGCLKACPPVESLNYYLGARLSAELMASPVNPNDQAKDIGLKFAAALDFPLTMVSDSVLVPFIAIRNAIK